MASYVNARGLGMLGFPRHLYLIYLETWDKYLYQVSKNHQRRSPYITRMGLVVLQPVCGSVPSPSVCLSSVPFPSVQGYFFRPLSSRIFFPSVALLIYIKVESLRALRPRSRKRHLILVTTERKREFSIVALSHFKYTHYAL